MVVVAYLRLSGFFALATERIAARFSGPQVAPGGDDRPLGRALGVPGQRRRLRRADAAGARPLPAARNGRRSRTWSAWRRRRTSARSRRSRATRRTSSSARSRASRYLRFAARLAPVAVLGLVAQLRSSWPLVYSQGAGRRRRPRRPGRCPSRPRVHRGLLVKSVAVTLVDDRAVLRGPADRDRGAGGGGDPAARPGPAREGVSADRLAAAGHVRRPVRRGPRLRGPRRPDLGPRALDALLDSPVVLVSGLSVAAVEPGLERPGGAAVQAADGGDARRRSRPGWRWRCRAPWRAT